MRVALPNKAHTLRKDSIRFSESSHGPVPHRLFNIGKQPASCRCSASFALWQQPWAVKAIPQLDEQPGYVGGKRRLTPQHCRQWVDSRPTHPLEVGVSASPAGT